ncbi:MAG: hypothetical protein Q9202_003115 [Teloschistes flavicans]
MSSFASYGSSSPDPLAVSQNGSSPTKPNDRRANTPRKILAFTTGNQQSPDACFAPSFLPEACDISCREDDENKHNHSSPWRVRVTVEAQPDQPRAHHSVPQCSPSKIYAERTYTTTVLLRGGDESSPVRRKINRTPQKSRNTPKTRQSTPKVSARHKSNAVDSLSMSDTSESPKRSRGRPRKSTETPRRIPSFGQLQTGHSGQQSTLPHSNTRDENFSASMNSQAEGRVVRGDEITECTEQNPFLDSIMESEGFSMVSVSSLPSNQNSSALRTEPNTSSREVISSVSTRHVTPTLPDESPIIPPPPKPTAALQTTRELDKPKEGTPRLARVVRAGIALQGVLSPAKQRRVSSKAPGQINQSSHLLAGASPKERLDELFSGFGPGTQRELRAGLRLGEELARRQGLETSSEPQQQLANEDVFGPPSEISYPQLPDPAASLTYSLKVPGSSISKSPLVVNPQLPSPADSEADVEDDRMSWKYDTLPRGAVSTSPMQQSLFDAGNSGVNLPLANETTMDSMAMWHQEQEQRCRKEREAVSKQIREANTSQVIVVNSDDEIDSVNETSDEEHGDIWQEEAQNSGTGQSTSSIPPIFLQTNTKKPRRSQLPSPWMRKSQDALTSSIIPSEADLFWQPNQAQEASQTSTRHALDKSAESKPTNSRLSLTLETASQIDSRVTSLNTESSFQRSQAAEPSHGPSTTSTPEATFLDQTFADSEPDDETYQDEESLDPLNSEDEDMASSFLDSMSMQDDSTSSSDESTQIDLPGPGINITSTPVTQRKEVSCMRTPLPPSSLSKPKTPKSQTPKHVRFSTELSRPRSLSQTSLPQAEPQPAPLPPAPASWLNRLTSYLPSWPTSAAAAIPLPSSPKKRIIRISELDQGPLPLYMPWTQRHWWAFINLWRFAQADPSIYPFFPDKNPNVAAYLNDVVTVRGWSKRITKPDCALVARCVEVFGAKGTYRGVERVLEQGMKAGKGTRQWGKRAGQLINVDVLFSALVCQWASAVMEGECSVGWNDRAGWKAGKGEGEEERERWSKRDLQRESTRTVYV